MMNPKRLSSRYSPWIGRLHIYWYDGVDVIRRCIRGICQTLAYGARFSCVPGCFNINGIDAVTGVDYRLMQRETVALMQMLLDLSRVPYADLRKETAP